MLNIKSLAVAETLTFQLVGPDDAPLTHEDGKPAMATVYGPGSKRYAQAQAAKQARTMAKLHKGKDLALTADEQARQDAEFLAAITDSLDIDYDGLEGDKKLLAIYSDRSIGFIAEQVAKKAGDWANFKQGSAKS